MTAPGADDFERGYEEILGRVSDVLERIQQKTVEMGERLDRLFHRLPPGVGTVALVALWRRYLRLKDDLFDELQEYVTQPGYPPALFRVGRYWDAHVGQPLDDLKRSVLPNSLDADDRWTGAAASAYKDAAQAQSAFIEDTSSVGPDMQSILHSLAWAVILFWVAVAFALAEFVLDLIVAVILIAGGITASAGLVKAIEGATVAIVLIGAAALAFFSYLGNIDTAVTSMRKRLGASWPTINKTVYDGTGRWTPQP